MFVGHFVRFVLAVVFVVRCVLGLIFLIENQSIKTGLLL